jgi:hypothetical protein
MNWQSKEHCRESLLSKWILLCIRQKFARENESLRGNTVPMVGNGEKRRWRRHGWGSNLKVGQASETQREGGFIRDRSQAGKPVMKPRSEVPAWK